ncbi:pentatricopeptide repeat-containing protein [Tripterygium wilfordii]|uniref:Pentatricopeptide repeat-containing protein n=1 Tax=Tripterygium wilfordii TaxID=458696 RepID=A0A7J7BYW9_TRIWF|nr:pentatricopeptide repeat-containing protein At1g06140, mitochondrial [Tripterygium wilfordii]KAF5727028.1 pentatricopeptide repeat-containing protein [Tripterygium wilfordii]
MPPGPPGGGKITPIISVQNPCRPLLHLFLCTKTLSPTKQLHAHLIIHGLHRDVLSGSKLANAYIELGSLHLARIAFDQISRRNLRSWNTIISGYSNSNRSGEVLLLYRQMRRECQGVDSFNLVFAIKAIIGLSQLRDGESVHCLAIKSGMERDPYVARVLVEMQVKLGSVEDARKVFEEVSERSSVLCGVMMKGYLKISKECEVFQLFSQMRSSGLMLDALTLEGLVRASGNVSAVGEGEAFHGLGIKMDLTNSNAFLHTSLIDMYMKCGLVDLAVKLFEEVDDKDVVLWTSMILGFSKNGKAVEALALFHKMLRESISLNAFTLASILIACSSLGSLNQGKSVHGYMIRNGITLDVVNYTSLIDMYAKCGCVATALRVFNVMSKKNVVSWSAIINAFGSHGLYSEAFAFFDQMISENQVPNSITFISVLSACSHSGKVEEGWKYFNLMRRDYGIVPAEEHYACMVDLLGKSGKIDDALYFINRMPIKPGASIWSALLCACKIQRRFDLAEEVAKKLLSLEDDRSGSARVLLSNVYADVGKWEMAKNTMMKRTRKGLHKSVGFTSIEVKKKLYVFTSDDIKACKNTQVETLWNYLRAGMKRLGYIPDLSFAPHDGEVKQEVLCGHSEKLAIVFGLLKAGDGVPIRVTKNLRVCGDCHTTIKYISLQTGRKIIMRDLKRFHYVGDGVCSCEDYW